MPPQHDWDSFFDPEKILDELELDTSRRNVLEFGCGYGTFTLPAARRISGKVAALDLDPVMLEATRNNAEDAGLNNIEGYLRDFVADGNLRIDGSLPNNTHGGLLSEGYIHGMNNIAEGARLIRGESTGQPAKNVEHVLVSSGVGVPTGALILGSD